MSTSTAGVLRASADLLEMREWGQGEDVPLSVEAVKDSSVLCAALAIAVVADRLAGTDIIQFCILAEKAEDALCKYLGTDRGVPGWNDEPGRTKAEVVAALLAAAVEAERAG